MKVKPFKTIEIHKDWFKAFKNREVKAKEIFYIIRITKNIAHDFVSKYHYLEDAKFFSTYSYGLYFGTHKLVGVSTYANPQGISALKSWFGFDNKNKTVQELTRLCMIPQLNGTNATSYLLGNSMKKMKKEEGIQAVITLADQSRHVGSIYQVCNFKYYGLTDKKTDFFTEEGKVNPRGKTKDVKGVWLNRARKHRYSYLLDKKLTPLLKEEPRPIISDTVVLKCCNKTLTVYDKRFNQHYTCPRCTGKLERICGVKKYLGSYYTEKEASEAYQRELKHK